MPQERNRREDATGKAMREFALGRAKSLNKYGALLTRFGNSEIGPEEFAQESFRIGFEESIQYLNDSVVLGSAYFGALSNLARTSAQRGAASTSASGKK